MNLWKSLYPNNKEKLYDYLSSSRWEKILQFNSTSALESGNAKLSRKISYALAIIFHRQTKYTLSTPLFLSLLKFKKELTQDQLKEVYLRLETSYRAIGQFSNAIQIRQLRINNGFVDNFWELYYASGLHREAIQDFKLFEKFPVSDDFEKVRYFSKIGNLYLDYQKPDSAIYYFSKMKQSADYIIKNKNYLGKTPYSEMIKYYLKALAQANISEGYMLKKKFSMAIPTFNRAIVFCNQIKEVDQKIRIWLNLAQCYIALNTPSSAKAYLDSSRTAMRSKRMLANELKVFKLFAIYSEQIGDNKAYIANMESYLKLKDSVLAINQKNQSTLLLTTIDVQRQKLLFVTKKNELNISNQDRYRQKQIIFYTTASILFLIVITALFYHNMTIQRKTRIAIANQNEQLLKNEIEISKQNAEKEIMLKEIHHRVKNNLQLVHSLLNLQKRRLQNEDIKQSLEAIQIRIKSMAMVHQQLYGDGNLKEIDVRVYIENLVVHLKNIFINELHEVELVYDIDKIALHLDKAIPVGLIINEAVLNSFKYAFRNQKSGRLKISFTKKETAYELIVEDNGVGFTDQEIKSTSLGLQLIKGMASQLKASYYCVSEKGTLHQFNFKI
nr:sensor histidine kinase [uncultured Flavobacterium sp.]